MTSFSISNKRRILEIAAVIVTAIGKFIFMTGWLGDFFLLPLPYYPGQFILFTEAENNLAS